LYYVYTIRDVEGAEFKNTVTSPESKANIAGEQLKSWFELLLPKEIKPPDK